MGRELQKKKRRSKRQPVRPKKPGKVLNPRGNTLIAKAWDKKETLTQNYQRLGLVSRLRGATGGTEKKLSSSSSSGAASSARDALTITPAVQAVVSEARVEFGPDGRIARVIDGARTNPLNDMLCALESDDTTDEEWGGIAEAQTGAATTDTVRQLVEMSHNAAPKRVHVPSTGERQWLQRLIDRHGDDTTAMARDMRLNPMQQTAADIARRIGRLRNTS
ncbi:hypothetical protein CDD82_2271 [Ophiocordyceps australis]|uniref:Nucleolar protein 16 n=1 Tax=Ophiocordyceps australis TaxID=1399860 RepID=A0A2C5ZVA4_9HYPO|nr:hypothetical protein CDD82_2271 [Ophiocordyceps australis]